MYEIIKLLLSHGMVAKLKVNIYPRTSSQKIYSHI